MHLTSVWLLTVFVVVHLVAAASGQSSLPRPQLTGLNHVSFRVSDVTAARRFYGDLLGLRERATRGGGVIVYGIGARQHVRLEPGVLPPSLADSPSSGGVAGPAPDERLSHVAFETTDVKALASYLTSRGVHVSQPPGRCEPTAIHVTDPDSHTIEFVQVSWPPEFRAPASPKLDAGSASEGGSFGAKGPLSTRLLHAGLIVSDEETAHRFYRDTLGFSEIWRGGRTEGVTDWVNMRVPDGTDYLEYMLVTAVRDRRHRGTLHHLCLLVPDIQTAWETVVRRTAPATRPQLTPPNVGRNGRWQLNVFDPDDTRTELMEPFRVR